MFTFVVVPTVCSILLFLEHKRGAIFNGRMKLRWKYGTDVKWKVQKEILRKPGTIIPIIDTKNLCLSNYSMERSQRQHKKPSRSRKSCLTSSGNLVEML